jgi:hypothetical protein
MDGISRAGPVPSAFMEVYSIPCHDIGQINVLLVLQGCRDSVQVPPGSHTDTLPALSYDTFDVSNVKLEEEIHIKEVEEINVKAKEDVGSGEEECMDIADQEIIYVEEEVEDVAIKEEVS